MRIAKVIIENYRSIKHIEIDIKPLFGLIGANSAGKSNILRALNLVLGDRYPMAHSLTKKDFYNEDFANNIKIEVHFDSPFRSYNHECKGIQFKTIHDSINNTFTTEYRAIECVTGRCQAYNLKGDTKERFSAVYVPATRNFEYHLQNNAEWSFLGKLIKQFNEVFPQEKIAELTEKFEAVKSSLETEKFREFESTFKEAFREHILPTENDVDIGFKAFDPKNYYKTIEIIPKEYESVKNIDQMGEGMKNLIFIALFRAYAKVFPESTIFLIEEPELYLHPQGRADLFNIFRSLAERGSQIIYTTHSQEFIDIEYFSNIGLVRKNIGLTQHYTEILQINENQFLDEWKEQTGINDASIDSIKLFLKNVSNAETNKGFFAKKIVLVEGQTEKWMFSVYAKKEGFDLEKNNVEIVNVSGKNNIEKFFVIFKKLNYPIYVIFDGDKTKQEDETTNKKLSKMLSGIEESFPVTKINPKYTIFEEDIETELKKIITNYPMLESEARQIYGLRNNGNKEIVARYIANKTHTPEFIKQILGKIKEC